MPEARLNHGKLGRIFGHLLKIAHADIPSEHELASLIALLAREDGEQSALSCSVLCYEPYMLAFVDREGYIFKKGEIIARVPESDLINSLEKIIMETYSLDK
jgi:hypothetical protein